MIKLFYCKVSTVIPNCFEQFKTELIDDFYNNTYKKIEVKKLFKDQYSF